MKAELIERTRRPLSENAFVEILIWSVPQSVRGSAHRYKYRLAYVENTKCVLRYDNEAGKGDHRHIGDVETPYDFRDVRQLVDDFLADVDRWRVSS